MQRISSHQALVRAATLAVAVVVLALAVVACGGSSSSSTTKAARKHHKTATKSHSSTTTTTASAATATQTQSATTTAPATATQTTPATGTQTSGGGAPVSPGQTQAQQTTPHHNCTSGPDCNPNGTPNVPGSSSPVNGKCPAGTSYVPPQDNGPALCVPTGTATTGGKPGAAGTTPSQ